MNKLAVFLEHIFEAAAQRNESVEAMLRYAKSCGIDLLECDHWRLAEKAEVRSLFNSCGLGISSIYEQFDMPRDNADSVRDRYMRLFETAAYFGADKVLCIPGFFSGNRDSEINAVIQRLNEMCRAARSYNITVTIEDYDDISSPCCCGKDIRFLLDNVDGLRYTFDTGNFRYCLEDAAEALTLLKDKIAHVHCKDRSYSRENADFADTNGKADLSGAIMYPSPVCEGVIGIPALIKELLNDGYDGIFAIEHFGAADQYEYIKRSADNLRNIIGETK